ncbi:thyroid transcription factor 1-associated protein 26 homolog isoform X2 [Brachyhypopomus gauderio]|uniref:thyroid transcription factor 1-associated protein 26 homolog isoform X2 n=1 Tax=Brachyhypopomus gauderio TaxID=698409 RepID=UPI0040422080
MAPVNPKRIANASFKGKNVKKYYEKGPPSAFTQKKKKWIPANKYFDGSVQEGQGFAFKQKQKVKQEYNKLLRKEKWRARDSKAQLTGEFPEHLKHLYVAEQQRLDQEEQVKRSRRKRQTTEPEEEEAGTLELTPASSSSGTQPAACPEISARTSSSNEHGSQIQRQRNQKKMSANQKMKQEYERIKEERERKRQEYLNDKAQREEALKKYKEKKMATYQLLKKKTKKGQPNLNLQMELLLQKIQAQRK